MLGHTKKTQKQKLHISRLLSSTKGEENRIELQLNKYETDPYFLQIFQSNTSVCLIISVFCKSCKPICEPEIVLKNFAGDFQVNPTDISCKNTFIFSVHFTNYTIRGNKHCHVLEILKKIWICLAYI